jgi:2-keto-3-deoxy-L-rhamnonate aldolase RhmA
MAAPAGKDSGALKTAPPGAVNQGALDLAKWKYGHAFDPPPDAKIWNPVIIKMMKGEKVVGVGIQTNDPEEYCAAANLDYDFTWAEMQHNTQERDWETLARMWKACPHPKAVPGVRVATNDERELQRAMDNGALVVMLPNVRSVEQGKAAVDHVMFPPLGSRSCCAGLAFTPEMWGTVPGGYRQTINQNVVIIGLIGTMDGVAKAREIAAIPGVTALFTSTGDIASFSGYKEGEPDFERLVNIVHDAAIGAGKRLCGPFSWLGRPDYNCFNARLSPPKKDTQSKPGPR